MPANSTLTRGRGKRAKGHHVGPVVVQVIGVAVTSASNSMANASRFGRYRPIPRRGMGLAIRPPSLLDRLGVLAGAFFKFR